MSEQQQPKADWEKANEADDELLTADDLVTEVILINGKPTITHVGLAKIANKRGISVTELNYKEVDTETDKGIFVWGSGKNREGEIRHAAHFQPRAKPGGKELPHFDWAKAWSKFQRNLFKMFLYGDELVDETLEKWKETKGKGNQQQQPPPQQQSQPKVSPKVSPLEQAKNNARNASKAAPTMAIMTELGYNVAAIHTAATELWGPDDKWDEARWKNYRTEIINLRKKQGALWEKLKPAEPEPDKSDDLPNDPAPEIGF